MLQQNELDLLRDTLRKCSVHTSVVSPTDPLNTISDSAPQNLLKSRLNPDVSVEEYIGKIEPNTMYKLTDDFKLCYLFFPLPSTSEKNSLFFIGPYLSQAPSPRELLELGEKLKVSPKSQRYLEEYYGSIPVIAEGDRLFILIDAFCERIWGSSFPILDVNRQDSFLSPLIDSPRRENFDDILVNMKALETRYSFENKIIQAVALGQLHKEKLLSARFNEQAFEKRVSDPTRNTKNYLIIMNTLLRKAAEQGGVHPVYIDAMSSEFAAKIEQITSADNIPLMKEMYSSYCRLVRKHALQKYSPVVQKTILIIDSDVSADLSLTALAEQQKISPGYLSTVFKKETGKTVSEHIRDKRIKHAMHLLRTTHLQVQTIALHCGIMDVQYFSKIFKKQIGKTPKEYRASITEK